MTVEIISPTIYGIRNNRAFEWLQSFGCESQVYVTFFSKYIIISRHDSLCTSSLRSQRFSGNFHYNIPSVCTANCSSNSSSRILLFLHLHGNELKISPNGSPITKLTCQPDLFNLPSELESFVQHS